MIETNHASAGSSLADIRPRYRFTTSLVWATAEFDFDSWPPIIARPSRSLVYVRDHSSVDRLASRFHQPFGN
jgi:hypothetical protein